MLFTRRKFVVASGAAFGVPAFGWRPLLAQTFPPPQYPNLFTGLIDGINYPARPTWQVAGVDYGVGPATAYGTATPWKMADGNTQLPPGCHYDHPYVVITADDVSIDGWWFDGWQLNILGDNCVVTNSVFDF